MTMQPFVRSGLFAVAAGLLFAAAPDASAQTGQPAAGISDGVVKIGLLLDMSGPYSENTGEGSATAARMAVEDFGGKVLGAPIEIVTADHHNSANRAGQIARDWFDAQHVDAIPGPDGFRRQARRDDEGTQARGHYQGAHGNGNHTREESFHDRLLS